MFKDGSDGLLGGGGGHGQHPSCGLCLLGDPSNTRPGGQQSFVHEILVSSRLFPMPVLHHVPLRRLVLRQTFALEDLRSENTYQTLFPATYAQKLRIFILRPAHRKTLCSERLVERSQMPVSLGVREDSVAVEYESGSHPRPP